MNRLSYFILVEISTLLVVSILLGYYLPRFYNLCDKQKMPVWVGIMVPLVAVILVVCSISGILLYCMPGVMR